MKKSFNLLSAAFSIMLINNVTAQVTSPTNVSTPPPQFVGFNGVGVPEELQIRNDFNLPISFHTNGFQRAIFTTNATLTSWNGNAGDGLSILAPPGTSGNLDLFTSGNFGQNETHARFGNSGQVSGQNNRFEFISTGAQLGNYYSTFSIQGIHRFDRGETEHGRLGTNNFWRFGQNNSGPIFGGLNASRMVEVVDNDVQFRLTFSQNTTGPNTDFYSNGSGNLQIMPTGGRVGINAPSNPLATIDVFGDARIRDVQAATPDALIVGVEANGPGDYNVRRLDFTGNTNEVLLGDGTWGTLPPAGTNIVAEQGVQLTGNILRLGNLYGNVNAVPLLSNREIRSNGFNLIFSGAGSMGVGLNFPTQPSEKLDVAGNGRFRNVPAQGGQSIILGLQNGANQNDIEFSRLEFSGNPGEVLLGNGTWGSVPTGTDDQNLTSATIDCNSNILTIGIENGNSTSVDLSCLATGGGTPGTVNGAHNGTAMSTLVTDQVALGQNVNQFGNPAELLNNREIPLNGFNIYFNGNPSVPGNTNRIVVGQDGGQGWQGKLHVNTIANNFSRSAVTGMIDGSNLDLTSGLFGLSRNGLNTSYGVRAEAHDGNLQSVGVLSLANGASNNIAYQGVIQYAGTGPIGGANHTGLSLRIEDAVNTNTGIRADVQGYDATGASTGFFTHVIGGPNVFGIRTIAQGGALSGPATNATYGIWAQSNGGSANPLNDYAGWFQGKVHVQGILTIPGGTVSASDATFKTNINDLTNALSIINQLQARTFNYDTTNYSDFNFETDLQMGLIAQEVEQVIPTIVSEHVRPAQYDSVGNQISSALAYKGVEYTELIPLLIAGMQEQQVQIESGQSNNSIIDSLELLVSELNSRLTLLENCLSNLLPALCQANAMTIESTPEELQEELRSVIDLDISNRNAIVLNQNVPNPFAERTVITYMIPESVSKAQIHFYDGSGKHINSVEISERGSGQINVFAGDLSSGVYTYSLVADGKIIATKRMVKE